MNTRSVRILTYSLISFLIGLYCYTKKVERNPRYGTVFYKLAQECEHPCSPEKRKYYYQKAVYHDPFLSDAYYQLAIIFEQEGDAQSALQLYKKVAELDFRNNVAYLKMAVNHFQNGEFDRAARYLKQAIKHHPPRYHEAHYYLGRIYEMRKDYKKAAREYNDCIRRDKEYLHEAYLRAGVGFYRLGKEKIASKYVQNLRDQKRNDLVDQLEQFMKTGQYPEYLTRINLTK